MAERSSAGGRGGTALGPWTARAWGGGGGRAPGEPTEVSGTLNLRDWQAGSSLGAPFRGTWPPGLPPGCSEDSPTPSPTSSAMKEPPRSPGRRGPEDRQERGRGAAAQREACVRLGGGGGGRRPVLGRGSRSQGGRREPRLNRARCRGGGLSSSGLRRGVCSSWPGSGARGEWALPPWLSSSSQRQLVTLPPRPGSGEASPAGRSSVSQGRCQNFLVGPLALGFPPHLTFSGERPLAPQPQGSAAPLAWLLLPPLIRGRKSPQRTFFFLKSQFSVPEDCTVPPKNFRQRQACMKLRNEP